MSDSQRFDQNYSIIEPEFIPPFSNAYAADHFMLALLYFFMFLIGTCGISSIWTRFLFMLHKWHKTPQKRNVTGENVFFIYIFVLTLVDFMVLLTLPPLISKIFLDTWIYGETACKLFLLAESLGKVMSGFVLAAISIDRFRNLITPMNSFRKNLKITLITLALLLVMSLALLLPMPIYSVVGERVYSMNPNNTLIMVRYVCWCTISEKPWLSIWTNFLFVFSFALPAFTIVIFYGLLVGRLVKQKQHFKNSHVPVKKISLYVSLLIVFYFVCWGPYWMLNLALTAESSDTNAVLHEVFRYIHLLPHINSTFNWIFYALLNSQFRRETGDIDMVASHHVVSLDNMQPRMRAATYTTGIPNGRPSARQPSIRRCTAPDCELKPFLAEVSPLTKPTLSHEPLMNGTSEEKSYL